MKRITWATGAALSVVALAAPMLISAPAQAASCTISSPAPVLNSPSPTSAPQWTRITLTGTSPAACGQLQVQRQIGTGPWTTISGIKPQKVASNNTFNFYVELGVVGAQRIRVFYEDQGVPIASNYRVVTVTQAPTPPVDQCADDATPPAFASIPSRIPSGQQFRVEGISPEVCGEVTLVKKKDGNWVAVGVDTPGPLNEVFYNVTQKVASGKTKTKKAYALRYTDEGDGDIVYSAVHKVVAYRT